MFRIFNSIFYSLTSYFLRIGLFFKKIFLTFIFVFIAFNSFTQVGFNLKNSKVNDSALVEIKTYNHGIPSLYFTFPISFGLGTPILNFPDTPFCNSLTDGMMFYDTIQQSVFVCSNPNWLRLFNSDTRKFINFNFNSKNLYSKYQKGKLKITDSLMITDSPYLYNLPYVSLGDSLVTFKPKTNGRLLFSPGVVGKPANIAGSLIKGNNALRNNFYNIDTLSLNHLMVLLRDSIGIALGDTLFEGPENINRVASILKDSIGKRLTPDSVLTINKKGFLEWKNISSKAIGSIRYAFYGLYYINDTVLLGGNLSNIDTTKIYTDKYSLSFIQKNNGGLFFNGLKNGFINDSLLVKQDNILKLIHPYDFFADTASLSGILLKGNSANNQNILKLDTLNSVYFLKNSGQNLPITRRDSAITLERFDTSSTVAFTSLKSDKLKYLHNKENVFNVYKDTLKLGGNLNSDKTLNLTNDKNLTFNIDKSNGGFIKLKDVQKQTKILDKMNPRDSVLVKDTYGNIKKIARWNLITDTLGLKYSLSASEKGNIADSQSIRNLDTLYLNNIKILNKDLYFHLVKDSLLTLDNEGNLAYKNISSNQLKIIKKPISGITPIKDTLQLGGLIIDTASINIGDIDFVFAQSGAGKIKLDNLYKKNTKGNGLDTVLLISSNGELMKIRSSDLITDTPGIAGILKINNNANNQNLLNLDSITIAKIKFSKTNFGILNNRDSVLTLTENGELAWFTLKSKKYFGRNGLHMDLDTIKLGGLVNNITLIQLDSFKFNLNSKVSGSKIFFNNLKDLDNFNDNDSVLTVNKDGEVRSIWRGELTTNIPNIVGVLKVGNNAKDSSLYFIDTIGFTKGIIRNINNVIGYNNNTDDSVLTLNPDKFIKYKNITPKALNYLKVTKNGISTEIKNDTISLGGTILNDTITTLSLNNYNLIFNASSKGSNVFENIKNINKLSDLDINDSILMISSDGTNALKKISRKDLLTDTFSLNNILKFSRIYADSQNIEMLDSFSFKSLVFKHPEYIGEFNNNGYLHTDSVLMIDTLGRFIWKDVRKIKPPKKLKYIDGLHLYGTYLDTIMLGGNVAGNNPIVYIDQNYDLEIQKNLNGNFKLQNINVFDGNYSDDSVLTLYNYSKIGSALPNQIQIDTPSVAAYIYKYNKSLDYGGNLLGIDTLFTNKLGITGNFKNKLPVLLRDSILAIEKETGRLVWRDISVKKFNGLNGLTNENGYFYLKGNSNLDTIKFNLDSSNFIFKRTDSKGDLKLSGLNLFNPNDKNFVYLIDSADKLEMVRADKLQTKITGIAGVLIKGNNAEGRDIKGANQIGLRTIKFKNIDEIKNANRQDSIITLSKSTGSIVYKSTNYLGLGYYRGANNGITKIDTATVSFGGKLNEDVVYKLDSLSFLELKLDGNTTKKGFLNIKNVDTTTDMTLNVLTLTPKENYLEQSKTHDILSDTPDIYGVLSKSINGGGFDFRIDTIELSYWRDTLIDKHSYNIDSVLTIDKNGYLKYRNISSKRTGLLSSTKNGLNKIEDSIFLGGKIIFDTKIDLDKYNFEIRNNGGNIIISGLKALDSVVKDTTKLLMISGNGILRQAYPWDLFTDTPSLAGVLLKQNNANHNSLNTGKGYVSLKTLIFDTSFNKWNFGLNLNDTVLSISKDGKFGRKKLNIPHRYIGKNGLSYIQGPLEGHDTLIFGGNLTKNTLINLGNYAWTFKGDSIKNKNGLRFNNIPTGLHTKNDSILLMDTQGFIRVVFGAELISDTPGIKAVLTKSRDAQNKNMRNIDTLFLNKFIFRNAFNIGKIGVRDSALTIDTAGNVRFVDITSLGLGYATVTKRGLSNKRDTAILGGSLNDSIMIDLANNNLTIDRNKTRDFKFISTIPFNTNADSVLIIDPITNVIKTVHRFNVTTDTSSIAGPLLIDNNARNYNIYNLDTISARNIKMLQIDSIYSYISDTFLILDGKGIVRQIYKSYNDTTNIRYAYNGLSNKKDTIILGGEINKLVSINSPDTSDIIFNFSNSGSFNIKNVKPLIASDINNKQYGIAVNHLNGEVNPIHPFSMITDTPNLKGVLVKNFDAKGISLKNVGYLNITNSVQIINNKSIVSESDTDSVLVYDSKNKGVIYQKSNLKNLGFVKTARNGIIRKDTQTVVLGGDFDQNTEFITKNQLKFNLNNKQQLVFNDLDTSINTNNIIIIDTLTNQLYQIAPSNLKTKTPTIAGVIKKNPDAKLLSIKNLDSLSFGTLKVDISKIANFKDYFLNPDTVFDDHILTANPKTNSLAYTSISHFKKNQKAFKGPFEVMNSMVNLNGALDSTRELNLNGYPLIFEQYSNGKLKFDLLKNDTIKNQMLFLMDSLGGIRYLYADMVKTDTVEFAGILFKDRNAQKQSFLNLDTIYLKNLKFVSQNKLKIQNDYSDTMLSLDSNNFIVKRRPNFPVIDSFTNGLKRDKDSIINLGDSLIINTSLFLAKGSWSFLLDTSRNGRNFKIYNLPTFNFIDSLIRPDSVLLVAQDGRVRKIFKGDLVMDTANLGEQLNIYNNADTIRSLKNVDSANINWFRFVSRLNVPKLDSLSKSLRDSLFVFDNEGNLAYLKVDSLQTNIKRTQLGVKIKNKKTISLGQDKLSQLTKSKRFKLNTITGSKTIGKYYTIPIRSSNPDDLLDSCTYSPFTSAQLGSPLNQDVLISGSQHILLDFTISKTSPYPFRPGVVIKKLILVGGGSAGGSFQEVIASGTRNPYTSTALPGGAGGEVKVFTNFVFNEGEQYRMIIGRGERYNSSLNILNSYSAGINGGNTEIQIKANNTYYKFLEAKGGVYSYNNLSPELKVRIGENNTTYTPSYNVTAMGGNSISDSIYTVFSNGRNGYINIRNTPDIKDTIELGAGGGGAYYINDIAKANTSPYTSSGATYGGALNKYGRGGRGPKTGYLNGEPGENAKRNTGSGGGASSCCALAQTDISANNKYVGKGSCGVIYMEYDSVYTISTDTIYYPDTILSLNLNTKSLNFKGDYFSKSNIFIKNLPNSKAESDSVLTLDNNSSLSILSKESSAFYKNGINEVITKKAKFYPPEQANTTKLNYNYSEYKISNNIQTYIPNIDGVYQIVVGGAGGAAAISLASGSYLNAGGGGGGAYCIFDNVPLKKGYSYKIYVGKGATYLKSNNIDGADGDSSYFELENGARLIANGGKGGIGSSSTNNVQTGGEGGNCYISGNFNSRYVRYYKGRNGCTYNSVTAKCNFDIPNKDSADATGVLSKEIISVDSVYYGSGGGACNQNTCFYGYGKHAAQAYVGPTINPQPNYTPNLDSAYAYHGGGGGVYFTAQASSISSSFVRRKIRGADGVVAIKHFNTGVNINALDTLDLNNLKLNTANIGYLYSDSILVYDNNGIVNVVNKDIKPVVEPFSGLQKVYDNNNNLHFQLGGNPIIKNANLSLASRTLRFNIGDINANNSLRFTGLDTFDALSTNRKNAIIMKNARGHFAKVEYSTIPTLFNITLKLVIKNKINLVGDTLSKIQITNLLMDTTRKNNNLKIYDSINQLGIRMSIDTNYFSKDYINDAIISNKIVNIGRELFVNNDSTSNDSIFKNVSPYKITNFWPNKSAFLYSDSIIISGNNYNFNFTNWTPVSTTRQNNTNAKYSYIPRINNFQYIISTTKQTNTSYSTLKNKIDRPNPKIGVVSCKYPYFETSNFSNDCDLIGTQLTNTTNNLEKKYYFYFDSVTTSNIEELNYLSLEFKASNDTLYYKTSQLFKKDTSIFKRAGYPLCTNCSNSAGNEYRYLMYSAFENKTGSIQTLGNFSPKSIKVRLDIPTTKINSCNINGEFEVSLGDIYPFTYLGSSLYSNPNKLFDGIKDKSFGVCMARGDSLTNVSHYSNEGQKFYSINEKATKFGSSSFGFSVSLVKNGNKNSLYTLDTLRIYKSNTIKTFSKTDNELQMPYKEIYAFSVDLNGKIDSLGDLGECKSSTLCEFVRTKSNVPVVEIAIIAYDYKTSKSYNIRRASDFSPKYVSDSLVNAPINRQGFFINEIEAIGREVKAKNSQRSKFLTEINTFVKLKNIDSVKLDPYKDFILMIDSSNNLFKINTQTFAKNDFLNYDSSKSSNIKGPVLSDVLIAGNNAGNQSINAIGAIKFDTISKLNQLTKGLLTPQVYTKNYTFVVPVATNYDLLLVAGGGAGGTGRSDKINSPGSATTDLNILKGSGGAGGGFIELNKVLLPAGIYTVKIGSGGKVGSGLLNVNTCGTNTNGGDGDSTELKGDNGVRIVVYGGKGGAGCETTSKTYKSTGLAKWSGINIDNSNINFISNTDTLLKRGNCGFTGINCGAVTSNINGLKYSSGGSQGTEYSSNCNSRPNLIEGADGFGGGGQGGYGGTCTYVSSATPYMGWVGTRGGNGVFVVRASGSAVSDPVIFYSDETDASSYEETKKKFSYIGLGTQTNINKSASIDSTVNYLRTMSNFAIHGGGKYNSGFANPGDGGKVQFFIDGFKRRMGIGTIRPQSILHLNSDGTNERARVNTTVHAKKFKHSLLTMGVDTNGDLLVGLDSGANDFTYDTIILSGGGIFSLPDGINTFYAIIVGGGGGSSRSCSSSLYGGAGGGGAVRTEYITGEFGGSFKYRVGEGGKGASSSYDGSDGENTYIGNYVAKGGGGGVACTPNGGYGGYSYYGDQTKYYFGALNNKVENGVNYYAGNGAGAGGKGSSPENGKGITVLGKVYGKGGSGGQITDLVPVNEYGSGANAVPLGNTTGLDGANGGIIVIYKKISHKRISLNVNQFKNKPFSLENSSNSDFETKIFKIDDNLSTSNSYESTYTISTSDVNNYTYDILVVGGGGGGAISGSAGGGGAVYEALNVSLPAGTYNIKVGRGGQSAYSLLYNSNSNVRVTSQNSCNINNSPNGIGATLGLSCIGDSSRISAVIGGVNYSIVAPGGSGGIGYTERTNANVTTDRYALPGGNGGVAPIISSSLSSLITYKSYSSAGRKGGGGLCDDNTDDWCFGQNGYKSQITGQYYGSGGGGGTSSSTIPFNGGFNAGKSALNLGASSINFMDKTNNGETDALNGYGGGASGGSLNQNGGFSNGGGGVVIIRKRPKLFYKVYTVGNYSVKLNAGKYNILVVGGGGGGANSGGGGGAVFEAQNIPLPAGTYNLTVGSGGKSLRAIDPTQSGYQSCNVATLGATNGALCNGQSSSFSATIEGVNYSITAYGGSGGTGWNNRINNNYNNNNGASPNGTIPGGVGGSAPVISSQIKSIASIKINAAGRNGGEGLCSPSTGKWCNGIDGYVSSITGKFYGSSGAGQSDEGANTILPSFIGGANAGNGGRRNNTSLLETDGVEGTGGGAGGGGIDKYGGLTVAGSGVIIIQEVTESISDYTMDYGNTNQNENKIYNQFLLATGTTQFEVTPDMYDFQIFAVGGGGGGSVECGSGGGGGAIFEGFGISLITGVYTISVGQGGLGGVSSQGGSGLYGGNTSFVGNGVNIAALGGDGGKSRTGGTCGTGVNGGKIIYTGLIKGININDVNAESNTITGQNSSDYGYIGRNGITSTLIDGVYGSSGGAGNNTTRLTGGTNAGSGSSSLDCTLSQGLDEYGGGGGGGGASCSANALNGGDGILLIKYKRIGYGTFYTKFSRNANQTFKVDQRIKNLSVLMVGGGGGGSINSGLGGAGGGVLYAKNVSLPYGYYNITIGDGGLAGVSNSLNAESGKTTYISSLDNSLTYFQTTGGEGGKPGANSSNTSIGGSGAYLASVKAEFIKTYTGGSGGTAPSGVNMGGSNGGAGIVINDIHYGPGGGSGSNRNSYIAKSGDGSYKYGSGGGGGANVGTLTTDAKNGRPNVGGGGGSANEETNKSGGKGGTGQVLLSYYQDDYILAIDLSDTNKISYLDVTNKMYDFEIILVGGGGSGGDSCAAGGGGGGFVYVKGLNLIPGRYYYSLGSGGFDAVSDPSGTRRNGNDTYFKSLTNTNFSIVAKGGQMGTNKTIGLGGTTIVTGVTSFSNLLRYNGANGQEKAQPKLCTYCEGYTFENNVYSSGGGSGAHNSINSSSLPPTITTGMFGGTNAGSGGYVNVVGTSNTIVSPNFLVNNFSSKGFKYATNGYGGGGGGNGGCFTNLPSSQPTISGGKTGSRGAIGYLRIKYKRSPKKVYRFTKSTSFNVTSDMQDIDILVVGAGGGGGGGGGGGAGGSVFEAKNVNLPIGGYNIYVGDKGLGGGLNTHNDGNSGSATTFVGNVNNIEYKITSPGGNGGSGWTNAPDKSNILGGISGGLPIVNNAMQNIISTIVTSQNGASGGARISPNLATNSTNGNGNDGFTSLIDGNVYGSGGGAGAVSTLGFYGGTNAGRGSGWNGVQSHTYIGNGSSAVEGYGGGGGGGGDWASGGNYDGSTGVVVIAFNLKSELTATTNLLNLTTGSGGVTLSSEKSSVNAFFLTKDSVKTGSLNGLASTQTTLFTNKVYNNWDIINRAGVKQISSEISYKGVKYNPSATLFLKDTAYFYFKTVSKYTTVGTTLVTLDGNYFDLIVVGGGGASQNYNGFGGGGAGGGVFYAEKINFPTGNYNLVVGQGATANQCFTLPCFSSSGSTSYIQNSANNVIYISAFGGEGAYTSATAVKIPVGGTSTYTFTLSSYGGFITASNIYTYSGGNGGRPDRNNTNKPSFNTNGGAGQVINGVHYGAGGGGYTPYGVSLNGEGSPNFGFSSTNTVFATAGEDGKGGGGGGGGYSTNNDMTNGGSGLIQFSKYIIVKVVLTTDANNTYVKIAKAFEVEYPAPGGIINESYVTDILNNKKAVTIASTPTGNDLYFSSFAAGKIKVLPNLNKVSESYKSRYSFTPLPSGPNYVRFIDFRTTDSSKTLFEITAIDPLIGLGDIGIKDSTGTTLLSIIKNNLYSANTALNVGMVRDNLQKINSVLILGRQNSNVGVTKEYLSFLTSDKSIKPFHFVKKRLSLNKDVVFFGTSLRTNSLVLQIDTVNSSALRSVSFNSDTSLFIKQSNSDIYKTYNKFYIKNDNFKNIKFYGSDNDLSNQFNTGFFFGYGHNQTGSSITTDPNIFYMLNKNNGYEFKINYFENSGSIKQTLSPLIVGDYYMSIGQDGQFAQTTTDKKYPVSLGSLNVTSLTNAPTIGIYSKNINSYPRVELKNDSGIWAIGSMVNNTTSKIYRVVDNLNNYMVWQYKPAGQTNYSAKMVQGVDLSYNSGGIWLQSGIVTPSDARIKTNIKIIDSAIDKIMDIRGVKYKWKMNPNTENFEYGYIAQEVEKVYPEFITSFGIPNDNLIMPSNDLKYKTILFNSFTAVTLEAIKTQHINYIQRQTKINKIKSDLEKQTRTIEDLKNKN